MLTEIKFKCGRHLRMEETKRKTKTLNLTEGSLFKKILIFSLPLMLSNVLQVLFNISDIAVVGRFAGSEALGSVGSTAIFVALFTGFLIGIGSGVNSLIAKHLGAGEDEDVAAATKASSVVSLVTGIIIAVLGIGLSRPLLLLLNTKPELIDGAVLYVRIYFCGMPALAIYNFGNGVFSADGDTKRPLIFLSVAGVVNILLNLLFVIVFKMSVAGVALASIISQYLSASFITIALCRTKRAYRLRFRGEKISGKKVKSVLILGLPAGFQNAIFSIANLFIQAGVNSFDTVMVEGNSAAANADAIIYDIMAAFYTACTSFMAQNLGAGKKDRLLKSYFVSLIYSFGAGAVFSAILALCGKYFLAIFTTEQAVIDAGMKRLVIMCFSYAVSAFMDATIAAARGLGKTVIPTVIVIMGSCVFRIIWIYTVFAYFKTIPSLYLLYIFSWAITAVAEIIYFAVIYKKTVNRMQIDVNGEK